MKPLSLRATQVVLALGLGALAGCAVGPDYQRPDIRLPATLAAVPTQASAADMKAPAVDLTAWWQSLGDPELNALIERALAENADVLESLDRLQAARTYERALLGSELPDAEASGGVARGTGSDLTRGRAAQSLISADNGSGLRHIDEIGGFDSVWELDLFGKYRRELQAAHFDTQALVAARQNVQISVIANVARAYIDLRGAQTRLSVLQANLAALRDSQRIASIRFHRGITNELDATLADRELATQEAELAPLQARVHAAQYAIAVLVGVFPEQLQQELASSTGASAIPAAPTIDAAGLPLDLLKQRPDIRQAEQQLGAATARIGVATADLFPQVAVTAAIGFQRQGLGSEPALGQHIWAAGPAALWPLLDFGTLDAAVMQADLRTRAQLAEYRRTLQSAVQDVDTAIDSYRAEQERLARLGDALVAAQRALDLARQRYDRGLTDFLNVVDAERQAYEIQGDFTDAQTRVADQFVSLYRALGGGWQNYQALPAIRRPEPAVIAAFRHLVTRDDVLHTPL